MPHLYERTMRKPCLPFRKLQGNDDFLTLDYDFHLRLFKGRDQHTVSGAGLCLPAFVPQPGPGGGGGLCAGYYPASVFVCQLKTEGLSVHGAVMADACDGKNICPLFLKLPAQKLMLFFYLLVLLLPILAGEEQFFFVFPICFQFFKLFFFLLRGQLPRGAVYFPAVPAPAQITAMSKNITAAFISHS